MFEPINPIAISLFGLEIHWYGIAYVLGFLFGYWYLNKFREDLKMTKDQIENLFLFFMILSVIGGRVFYIVFYNPGYFIDNPLDVIRFDKGGMSIHGGFFFGLVTLWYFSKKYKFSLLKLFDIFAVPLALALSFGRLANYVNQELVGRITTSGWGVVFPMHDNELRWPSTLFESAKNMLTYQVVLYLHFFKSLKPGVIAAWFFILYSFPRFVIGYVREPDVWVGFITMGQFLSLLSGFFGLALLYYSSTRVYDVPSKKSKSKGKPSK